MFKSLSRIILAVLIISVLLIWNPSIAQADIEAAQLAKAVQEIEYLDAMRSGLASTLEGQKQEPTIQTFKEVCQPVGMRAKQLSQENGWQVKQIAKKYRNSAHAPDNLHSQIALAKFEQNPELIGFWEQEKLNGKDGIRYYRRINVEASCLACHGRKNSRPQFVKDKYPQDPSF